MDRLELRFQGGINVVFGEDMSIFRVRIFFCLEEVGFLVFFGSSGDIFGFS